MRGIVSAVSLAVLFTLRFTAPGTEKTEAGLIAAWEQEQKSDPTTIKFEKTKDRQYHFSTKRFPFDGELLVRNVVLENYPGVNQDGISTGTVEVELQGVTDDFHRTFATSYANWSTGNTLFGIPRRNAGSRHRSTFNRCASVFLDRWCGPPSSALDGLASCWSFSAGCSSASGGTLRG